MTILFGRISRALPLALLALSARALTAQTVVTPTNPNGWVFFDGKPGTPPSPAQITNTMPGPTLGDNGSLQLTVTNGGQQPAAFLALSPGTTLASLGSLTFSYFCHRARRQVAVAHPCAFISTAHVGCRSDGSTTDGSMGWDVASNGTTDAWTTQSFSLTSAPATSFSGPLAVRWPMVAPPGTAQTGSFDDRMQTLNSWDAACTGAGTTYNLSNAVVTGIEIDYGSFPGLVSPSTVFLDDLSFQFGAAAAQSYNFETDAGSTQVRHARSRPCSR